MPCRCKFNLTWFTLNTTAKINYLQDKIYIKIKNSTNKEKAITYLKSQLFAIEKLKEIIKNENIDCDLKKVDSYIFANTKNEITDIKEQYYFLKNNGIDIKEKSLPANIKFYKSYYVNDTYIFNPIKYINSLYNVLDKKIHIYENTKILKVKKENSYYICYTDKYKIRANKVVFTCINRSTPYIFMQIL